MATLSYSEELLLYAPADYDVNKIGFILIGEDSSDDMDIDFELTPKVQKQEFMTKKSSKAVERKPPNNYCHICQRYYMNRSNLKRHMNTVHKNRKLHCHKCNIVFDVKRKHTYHMKRHEADKNFICDVCGAAENSRKDIKLHLVMHRKIDIDLEDIFQ